MGLHDELVAELAEAFDGELVDAVTEFVGTRTTDSATGEQPSIEDWLNPPTTTTTLSYSGKGIFSDYSEYELNSDIIQVSDKKLICLQSAVTVQPKIDDRIDDYTVVRVEPDPVGATYEIQLRRV